jgi:hypothetical protein
MNYNLICIFICTPICTNFLFLQKVGVTSMLVVMPVHTALSLELPAWVRKAMVKIMHSFLWTGTDTVQGGKSFVACSMVQRPLHLGGLGIPDLRVMGMALRLRWLWMQWCDNAMPWLKLPVATDKLSKAFFKASIICRVGNGEGTLFWLDPWLDGWCIEE